MMKNAWVILSALVMATVAFAAPPPVPAANGKNLLDGSTGSTVVGLLPQVPLKQGYPAPNMEFGILGATFAGNDAAVTACFQTGAVTEIELQQVAFSLESPDTGAAMSAEIWQQGCTYDPPGLNSANQDDAKRNTLYAVTGQTGAPAPYTSAAAVVADFSAHALFTKDNTGSTATNGLLIRLTLDSNGA
ncbi:MAG: hypothetical protein EBR82_75765, partial [Caulobacteraceae bacterium]|nr:hypothetical protein [Caulobacteraceae bacterium]